MIDTIFYSLIFDYDIKMMENSGRHWAQNAYKGKDYIFEYSAASIATVLHHNPTIDYHILTDDQDLLEEKLSNYDIDDSHLVVQGCKQEIDSWKRASNYCFWPILISMEKMRLLHKEKRLVKLDNDLTCLKPLDERFYAHVGSHVWKYERLCSGGREYWGERLAARTAFGTENFKIYNTGVFSFHPDHNELAKELPQLCGRAAEVDISSVSYFPDKIGVRAKMWSCVEQTANDYWLHKHQIPVMETNEYFFHHCYTITKEGTIKEAGYLRK
jgi:hypothetical protein